MCRKTPSPNTHIIGIESVHLKGVILLFTAMYTIIAVHNTIIVVVYEKTHPTGPLENISDYKLTWHYYFNELVSWISDYL